MLEIPVIALVHLITTIALLLVTIALVWVTYLLVKNTRAYSAATTRLVEFETRPHVVVYVDEDPARPTIIQIVIENVGRAMAFDLHFDLSADVPNRAWGVEKGIAKVAPPMTNGPIMEGIPALGPGASRRIDWGQYWGLHASMIEQEVGVTCRFRNDQGVTFSTENVLEIGSFRGTPAVNPPLVRVALALEAMGDLLKSWAAGR